MTPSEITPEWINKNARTSSENRMEIRLETQNNAVIFECRKALSQMGASDIVSTKMKTKVFGKKMTPVTYVYYTPKK